MAEVLKLFLTHFPVSGRDTKMLQGLRSIISFGFTNVFSIAAVTFTIMYYKEHNCRLILPFKLK